MEDLEKRVAMIEKRNKKVELDKAWETSWIRRLTIALLTYIVVVLYLFVIKNNNPFINGIVPVAGFVLSTLALENVKNRWEERK